MGSSFLASGSWSTWSGDGQCAGGSPGDWVADSVDGPRKSKQHRHHSQVRPVVVASAVDLVAVVGLGAEGVDSVAVVEGDSEAEEAAVVASGVGTMMAHVQWTAATAVAVDAGVSGDAMMVASGTSLDL